MASFEKYIPTDDEVLAALAVIIPALRKGEGRMAGLKSPAVKEAVRMLALHSEGGAWYETRWTPTPSELAAIVDIENGVIKDPGAFAKLRRPPKPWQDKIRNI